MPCVTPDKARLQPPDRHRNQFIFAFPNPLTLIFQSFSSRYDRLAHWLLPASSGTYPTSILPHGTAAFSRRKTSTTMKNKTFVSAYMGQKMQRIGTRHVKTASGYVSENARYRAIRCEGCPLRCRCFKAKGNRTIELNHRLRKYKQKAKELLCSEEGLKHRGQRCIEPEAVFGQMKNNIYKRFADFALPLPSI